MDRVDIYTTLAQPISLTLKGCNLDQDGLQVMIGALACETKKTGTFVSVDDDTETTLACSLPVGPLKPKNNDVIILDGKGQELVKLSDAVSFTTPTLLHVLPASVASAAITVRLGVSGLIQKDDPLNRYIFTLAGLPATAQAIGRFYANVRVSKLPDGVDTKSGSVVVFDKVFEETVIDTADERFTIEKRASYVSNISPTWAFAQLAEPVALDISVRNVGTVTSVTVSGVPCTNITRPTDLTVRCSLGSCPDAACVGPRPDGLVLTHTPKEAPEAPEQTATFYFQYLAVPEVEGHLIPMQTFPHNLAHRVTVHFKNNSLDASVPIKLYVGNESVCSCAITNPWALHFLLDPTSKEGNLPLSFMLTNGVVRGYNVPGGISFSAAVSAPGITLMTPQTFTKTAKTPAPELAIFGYGFAPVERLANSTELGFQCEGGRVYTERSLGEDGEVPPVASFQLAGVRYLDRNGVSDVRNIPLTLVPGPFGEPGKITVNGTRVRAEPCSAAVSPIGCVSGRYRVVGVNEDGAAVTSPAPNGEGGILAADEIEIVAPEWDGESVSMTIVLALPYTDDTAAKTQAAFWAVVEQGGEAFSSRIVYYGIEKENESESEMTVVFLPTPKTDEALVARASSVSPAQSLADAFAKKFLTSGGVFEVKIAKVVDYRSADVEFCSDATFKYDCASKRLKPWMIIAICAGAAVLLLIVIAALCCKCKKKTRTPIAISQINSSDDVYHRISK
jgi:hypothetical protein